MARDGRTRRSAVREADQAGSGVTGVLMPLGRRSRSGGRRGVALVRSLLLLAAFGIGTFAGYVDLMSASATPALVVVAVGGLVLALIRPANGWLYAVIMGCAIPVAHLIAPLVQLTEAHIPEPNIAVTVLAVAPALAGSLAGMLLHRGLFGAAPRRASGMRR